MQRTPKVIAYILGRRGLLVFTHPDHRDAGLQVPAGTIHESETPEEAVLREVAEETGLRGVRIDAYLGCCEYDMRAFGRDEVQVRHFLRLKPFDDPPEAWEHFERNSSGHGPIRFRFEWMDLEKASRLLVAGHAAMLRAVVL